MKNAKNPFCRLIIVGVKLFPKLISARAVITIIIIIVLVVIVVVYVFHCLVYSISAFSLSLSPYTPNVLFVAELCVKCCPILFLA
jgi:hypothetical protein